MIAAVNTTITHIIFTTDHASADLALNELRQADATFHFKDWLAEGVDLVESQLPWPDLSLAVRNGSIFIRHLQPVLAHVELDQQAGDLEAIDREGLKLREFAHPDRSFSVQTRMTRTKGWPYKPFDINNKLAASQEEHVGPLDIRDPEQILSVFCSQDQAYLGWSSAAENLSNWAGGVQRFRREPDQISRAEFKLLEPESCVRLTKRSIPSATLAVNTNCFCSRRFDQGDIRK